MPVPRSELENLVIEQALEQADPFSLESDAASVEFEQGVRDARSTRRHQPRSENPLSDDPDYLDGWNSVRQV